MNLISKLFPQKEKCCKTAEKNRILIIGGAGHFGKFVVEASAKSGHPTFALINRGLISDPTTGELIEGFKDSGVTILIGDVDDEKGLVTAIKQVNVVISAMGYLQISDQVKILAAIKKAGNVKRFFPSEFGNDVDRGHKLLRDIKAARVPYTYITLNYITGSSLSRLGQLGAETPPRDKVVIFGDGNSKAVFNNERDVGTYIVKAVDDPRTLNKILYIRPPKNIYSLSELVALWEKKIGKTLEKEYIPEEQLLKQIQGEVF